MQTAFVQRVDIFGIQTCGRFTFSVQHARNIEVSFGNVESQVKILPRIFLKGNLYFIILEVVFACEIDKCLEEGLFSIQPKVLLESLFRILMVITTYFEAAESSPMGHLNHRDIC